MSTIYSVFTTDRGMHEVASARTDRPFGQNYSVDKPSMKFETKDGVVIFGSEAGGYIAYDELANEIGPAIPSDDRKSD